MIKQNNLKVFELQQKDINETKYRGILIIKNQVNHNVIFK